MSPIPTVPGGTYVDVGIVNHGQQGDETVEIWLREIVSGSGEVSEPAPGVFRGATDFSEFEVGAVLPAGITYSYNIRNGITVSHEIGEDPEEGRYMAMSYTPVDDGFNNLRWVAYSLDAWDDVQNNVTSDDLEMLARVYFPPRANHDSGFGDRYIFGPTQKIEATGGDYSSTGVVVGRGARLKLRKQTDDILLRHAKIQTTGGSGGSGETAEVILGEAGVDYDLGEWKWIRVRWTRTGGGLMERRFKSWAGAIADEPGAWDVEDDGTSSSDAYDGLGRLGWTSGFNEPYVGSRIAYLAFTTDPVGHPVQEAVPEADTPWYLAAQRAVQPTADQVERVTALEPGVPLTPGTTYKVSLRYRRGVLYNPGAENTADPSTWPSVSRGEFTTTVDPPAVIDGEWRRTSDTTEEVAVTVTPVEGVADQDVHLWRRDDSESPWTNVDTVPGPHVGDVELVDDTIAGETLYEYAVSTGVGARSDAFSMWTGPAGIPTYSYQAVVGGGYLVGFVPADVAYETALHDSYDDAGGVTAMSLRSTAAAGEAEVESGNLTNIGPGGITFPAKLRHKATAFTVDDFGAFGPEFDVTVPESE